jgi:hypothetical protein
MGAITHLINDGLTFGSIALIMVTIAVLRWLAIHLRPWHPVATAITVSAVTLGLAATISREWQFLAWACGVGVAVTVDANTQQHVARGWPRPTQYHRSSLSQALFHIAVFGALLIALG